VAIKLNNAVNYSGATNDMLALIRQTPVIGFCAYSGTGKTTLLKKVIPILRDRQLRIAVIKHAHHDFEIDHPGKDSIELRQAGAGQVLVSSRKRKALMVELEDDQVEPTLPELINDLDHSKLDLILIEGFKQEAYYKIELHRDRLNKPLLYKNDPNIIAIATDHVHSSHLPVLDINQTEQIVDFMLEFVCLKTMKPNSSHPGLKTASDTFRY